MDKPYDNTEDVSADQMDAEEGIDYNLGLTHYRKALVALL